MEMGCPLELLRQHRLHFFVSVEPLDDAPQFFADLKPQIHLLMQRRRKREYLAVTGPRHDLAIPPFDVRGVVAAG